jgi:predicted MPP superfamily phosphohydrolase
MLLFLILFLSVYGSLHLYFYLKTSAAFLPGPGGRALLIFCLALLLLAPVIIHWLERLGLTTPTRWLAYAGYIWMGFLFLFLCTALSVDFYKIVLQGWKLIIRHDVSPFLPSTRFAFVFPALLALAISIYGIFEARTPRTERLVIQSSKIPAETGSLKIAQISDVHLGLTIGKTHLQKVLKIIEVEKPDILVCTGDLLDGDICNGEDYSAMLSEVQTPAGKFAVTGNHEFYAGLDQSLKCLQEAGFTVLRGEAVEIPGLLIIAGVDDPTGTRMGLTNPGDVHGHLKPRTAEMFTVLLKHQPIIDTTGSVPFDLQLSGHTHKGQIFPFNLLTRLFFTVNAGHLELDNGSHLYVSRGTGSWGPPIRFLAPPEVTIIELVHEEE